MEPRNSLGKGISGIAGLAFFAPSACAGIYVFLVSTGSVGDRLLSALIVAFLVPFAAGLGFCLCLAFAATVMGQRDVQGLMKSIAAPNALAGLLLVTLLWIWWQHDKHTVVGGIAACVETASRSSGEVVNGETVITCYEELGAGDNSSDP